MAYKVLAILRASTMKQEVESQKMELGKYLHSIGFSEDEIRYEAYKGASAAQANTSYMNMINDIKTICTTTEIKAVAFWHLNRLGRIERYLNEMKNFFIDNKIQVYLNNPPMQLLRDNGEVEMSTSMVWSLFAIMIAEDTKELKRKTQRGIDYAKQQGLWTGGGVLFGFKVEKQKVVPDYEIGKYITKMFKMYLEGQSIYAIEDYLKSVGHTTPRITIHRYLTRKEYRGLFVSEEVFDKVQKIKKEKKIGSDKTHRRFLFGEQLIVCSECGNKYMAAGTHNWFCSHHTQFYKNTLGWCNNTLTISEKYLSYVLWRVTSMCEAMFMLKSNKEKIAEIDSELAEIPNLIVVQQKVLDGVRERKNKVADLYINGIIDKERMEQRIADINKEENDASEKIAELNKKALNLGNQRENLVGSNEDGAVDNIVEAKMMLDELSHLDKYKLVHKWIERCDYKRVGEWRVMSVLSADDILTEFASKGKGAGAKYYIYRDPEHKQIGEEINEDYLQLIPKELMK